MKIPRQWLCNIRDKWQAPYFSVAGILVFSVALFLLHGSVARKELDLRFRKDILRKIRRMPVLSTVRQDREDRLIERLSGFLKQAGVHDHMAGLHPGKHPSSTAFLEAGLDLRSLPPERLQTFIGLVEAVSAGTWIEQAVVKADGEGMLDMTLKIRMPRGARRREAPAN